MVTYSPYLELGDNGPFAATDQIVVAWQTNEGSPNPGNYRVDFGTSSSYGGSIVPAKRVVDNYLAADGSLPVSLFTYGAHTNYSAVLSGLSFSTIYFTVSAVLVFQLAVSARRSTPANRAPYFRLR